ncbi:MAG: DUF4919 domain-containing protein [Bacteroidales bacterium]|nr:DUF4919 domain-containing protein [Bacteroidales bacterium]
MRKGLICIILLGVALSLGAQETDGLPSAERTRAILDSIYVEGIQLYIHEKNAWVIEDCFNANASRKNKVHGWVPHLIDDTHLAGVFYNLDDSVAVFEAIVSLPEFNTTPNDTLRPLTQKEISIIEQTKRCLKAAEGLDIDLTPPEGTTYNVDIFNFDDNSSRVYFILGTDQQGIIPFGADFSYDCDPEGNVTSFRRYHKSYIPIPTRDKKGKAAKDLYISHTDLCPFIAPTEIAQFLLYGYELADIQSFSVYSAPLKCTFKYDVNSGLTCDAYPEEQAPRREIYPVNWKEIKDAAKKRPDEIKALAARLAAPEFDKDLTMQEMILAFYGMGVLSGIAGQDCTREAEKKYQDGDFAGAYKEATAVLEDNCLSLRALLYAGFSCDELAKAGTPVGDSKEYFSRAIRLFNTIASTGYGDKDHPFCVTTVADEYDFMRYYLNLWKYASQALTSNNCDKFVLSEQSQYYSDKEIYFDATWPFEVTASLFSGL